MVKHSHIFLKIGSQKHTCFMTTYLGTGILLKEDDVATWFFSKDGDEYVLLGSLEAKLRYSSYPQIVSYNFFKCPKIWSKFPHEPNLIKTGPFVSDSKH